MNISSRISDHVKRVVIVVRMWFIKLEKFCQTISDHFSKNPGSMSRGPSVNGDNSRLSCYVNWISTRSGSWSSGRSSRELYTGRWAMQEREWAFVVALCICYNGIDMHLVRMLLQRSVGLRLLLSCCLCRYGRFFDACDHHHIVCLKIGELRDVDLLRKALVTAYVKKLEGENSWQSWWARLDYRSSWCTWWPSTDDLDWCIVLSGRAQFAVDTNAEVSILLRRYSHDKRYEWSSSVVRIESIWNDSTHSPN